MSLPNKKKLTNTKISNSSNNAKSSSSSSTTSSAPDKKQTATSGANKSTNTDNSRASRSEAGGQNSGTKSRTTATASRSRASTSSGKSGKKSCGSTYSRNSENGAVNGLCARHTKQKYEYCLHTATLDGAGRCVDPRIISEAWIRPWRETEMTRHRFSVENVFRVDSIANIFIDLVRDFRDTQLQEKSKTNKKSSANRNAERGLFTHEDDMETPFSYVEMLVEQTIAVVRHEPKMLLLNAPLFIIGDLQGSLHDLALLESHLFRSAPILPHTILFLGNYSGTFAYGIECVLYVFALKVAMPNSIYLLRGRSELRSVDDPLGRELCAKYGAEFGGKIYAQVHRVFECLPVAALVEETILCAHSGIPRLPPDRSLSAELSVTATATANTTALGSGGGSGVSGNLSLSTAEDTSSAATPTNSPKVSGAKTNQSNTGASIPIGYELIVNVPMAYRESSGGGANRKPKKSETPTGPKKSKVKSGAENQTAAAAASPLSPATANLDANCDFAPTTTITNIASTGPNGTSSADPNSAAVKGFLPVRAGKYYFDRYAFRMFLEQNGIDYLIRSHNPCEEGYAMCFRYRCCTIFSCRKSSPMIAVAHVNESRHKIRFIRFDTKRLSATGKPKARPAGMSRSNRSPSVNREKKSR